MTEPYPDEMFEEAERREAENKVLKIGIECMERYDGALKQLAAIEREELKEELEVLKKKNFQDVADCVYDRIY